MRDMMIDIETLGTHQDAIVIAIGARMFDPESGKLGSGFYSAVNYQDQIEKGRKVSESTIEWWMSQDRNAQKVFSEKGQTTEDVLNDFYEFCIVKDGLRPWGNGPSFDLTIMESLFRDFGHSELPWKFWNVRCLRTFKDYIYDGMDIKREGVFHHALDDADHQIKVVVEGLKRKHNVRNN